MLVWLLNGMGGVSEMITQQQYDELKAERDALAAQVEKLLAEFKNARKTLQTIASLTWDSGSEEIADVALAVSKLWVSRYDDSVLKNTPAQHLAKIRADAIDSVNTDELFNLIKPLGGKECGYEVTDWLEKQAAKLRQGAE